MPSIYLVQLLQVLDVFLFLLFIFFVGIPVGIASSVTTIEIYVVTAGIKKYKSIIKKKKKHDKVALLAKTKLNTIEVSISKALLDSLLAMMNLCW